MTGSTISGLVTFGVTLGGNYASPLTITATGEVVSDDSVFAVSAPASVASGIIINDGTISPQFLFGGVGLFGDDTLINAGLITSAYGGDAVFLHAGGTVFNTGSIVSGAYDYGVVLAAGGLVTNSGIIAGGLSGLSTARAGIYLKQGGTISNAGTIDGGGGEGGAEGVLAVAGGTVTNTGFIIGGGGEFGAAAVAITNGGLINNGTLTGGAGSVYAGAGVAQSGGAGSNSSLITGGAGAPGEAGSGPGGAGLVLQAGGTFTNAGTLHGGAGSYEISYQTGGPGGDGATIDDGGVLINSGLILGGQGGYSRVAGAPNSGAGVYIDGGAVINSGDIAGGGPSPIAGGSSDGEPGYAVKFGQMGGVLTLTADGQLDGAGPIGGFAGQDSIVLDGLTETAFNYIPDLGLEVYHGEFARLLDIEGNFNNGDFTLTTDGGNTTIALAGTSSVNPCFAAGTRILTPRGEIAVEHLAIGDQVITHAGEDRPIMWIGRRKLDFSRHPRPAGVRPIIIEADALADGVPARRLVVSPDHALYLDNVLVPAKDLLNGSTIHPDFSARGITYFHVELASHDILLAEGTPAESYLDTGHRGVFGNAAAPLLLHPDLMQIRREREGCAPLCTSGATLAAIRARLAARLTESAPDPAAVKDQCRAV